MLRHFCRWLSLIVMGLVISAPLALAQDLVVLDCEARTYLGSPGFDCANVTGGSAAHSLISAPSVLNPITSQDQGSNRIFDHNFGGAENAYNVLAQGSIGTIPSVAKIIDVSEDGASVTYTIRDGLKYSDGSSVTIEDILYWYHDVTFNPHIPNSTSSLFTCSDGSQFIYEALSASQLRISCGEPYRTFTGAAGVGYVMSKQMALDLIEAQDIPSETGVTGLRATREFLGLGAPIELLRGLGPFILTQFDSQARARFERNPNFYEVDSNGTRLPYLDRFEVIIIPTQGQNLSLSNFLAGQTEMIDPRASDISPIFSQAAGGGFVVNLDIDNGSADDGTDFVTLNFDDLNPGLAEAARNVKVRRALSLAIDRIALVNSVLLGFGVPQYTKFDAWNATSGGLTYFIGRNNTCDTFTSLSIPCSADSKGNEILTLRGGVEVNVKNLHPLGLTPEGDQHLGCLVDFAGCVELANSMLDEAGYTDTNGDGNRNLTNGEEWRIQVSTNVGNTNRENYILRICDNWRALNISCSANPIAFATLVTQLLGFEPWTGGIMIGLTGGDPAGSANTLQCGAPLYFWHMSCDPEAISGPTAQDPYSAAIEAGFDEGFAATTVEAAQIGFDKEQIAFLQGEPFIALSVDNDLFAVRTDRLCNDGRQLTIFDDVKFRVDLPGNESACASNVGR